MKFLRCGALIPLLIMAAPAGAQSAIAEPDINLRIRNLRGNLYLIDDVKGANSDAGGNVGALIGEDGVVLVDSMVAEAAPEIPAILATVTGGNVRYVINTHWHPDHRGGFGVFAPTATIIAHPHTYRMMSSSGPDATAPAEPESVRPDLLVSGELTMRQNGETVEIRHYPRAHTAGDLVIFFRGANVVQMGDTYFAGMFQFVDDGGHIDGVIALMEDVLARTDADTLFIPGHGPVSTRAELSASLAMLRETRAIAADGIRRGLTVAQLVDESLTRRFERWSHGYIDTTRYFEHLYEVLDRS